MTLEPGYGMLMKRARSGGQGRDGKEREMKGGGKWTRALSILFVLLALGALLGCTKAKPLPREIVAPSPTATPVAQTPAAGLILTPVKTPSAKPTEAQTPAAKSSLPTPAPMVTYVVQAGDTAFSIARRFGIDLADLVAANDLPDPSRLAVGQQLKIPPPSPSPTPAGRTYTVRTGDTLQAIAIRFSTTVEAIAQANNLREPYLIYPGQVLVIP